jgi:hypothetical protein
LRRPGRGPAVRRETPRPGRPERPERPERPRRPSDLRPWRRSVYEILRIEPIPRARPFPAAVPRFRPRAVRPFIRRRRRGGCNSRWPRFGRGANTWSARRRSSAALRATRTREISVTDPPFPRFPSLHEDSVHRAAAAVLRRNAFPRCARPHSGAVARHGERLSAIHEKVRYRPSRAGAAGERSSASGGPA